ncbi:MAG: PfkB family carbohydrate kinase [Polyangiales bacterium]
MSTMLVVGSVAFDTLGLAEGTRHPRVLGGSALYAALAGSKLTPVQLVGVVGEDFPHDALDMLRRAGVDLEGLQVRPGKTFHWEGQYTEDLSQRTSLRTDLNVFADFRADLPEIYRQTRHVLIGNIHPQLQLEVIAQAHPEALIVTDTMNLWIDTELAGLKQVLRQSHILIVNEEEAAQITGEHMVARMGRALRQMGPETVVIKQGPYGAMLFSAEDVFSVPGYPLDNVTDPTGAGDCFAGGFVASLCSDPEPRSRAGLRRAAVVGSALASSCVEGVGPERIVVTSPEALEARLAAFAELSAFPSRPSAVEAELARQAS